MPQSPRRSAEFQWLEMVDFSPGIFSNNKLSGGVQVTATNPCMAQETNTWRCTALPSGGLGPLPRLQNSYGLTTIPNATSGITYNVTGFNTWGRIIDVPNTSTLGFEAHVMLYYQIPTAMTFTVYLNWMRERLFNVTPSTETITTKNLTLASTSAGRYTYFLKTRMNPATPDEVGTPVMVCVSSRIAINDIIISRAWPDPAAPTTNGTIIVGEAAEADPYVIAAVHQGRVVLGEFRAYSHGVNAELATNENIFWTDTNDNTLTKLIDGVTDAPAAQFVPELDQSISDICPMSANSLLVIKQYGGGYVLQGDLSDVTLVQLPNLPCPDGSDYTRGVNTSKGYVYSAGPAGMYLWNGGDGAELISSQLDGNFAVGNNFISGANGQCDRWIDRVLVPQNWVWDIASGSWWRIEDPSVVNIRYWSTVAQNAQAVGAETSFTTASPEFMHRFTYTDLAYSWSWQSHPIWVSQDRFINTREVLIAIEGEGEVTVTLINESGGTASHTFASSATAGIDNYRANMALRAENMQVRIEAVGGPSGDGTAAAPTVHRLYLGYVAEQHLALSTSA